MKRNLLLLSVLVFATPAWADCMSTAKTQSDLNDCAGKIYQAADAELNQIYQKILAKLKQDPAAAEKVRVAQRAWLAFRDAQLDMYFPARPGVSYGSIQVMCEGTYMTQLTKQRIKELNEILNPPQVQDCPSQLFYNS